MKTRVSLDEYDRDKRISALEEQLRMLTGQLAARDAIMPSLLREVINHQANAGTQFIEQYPQMLADIDLKVAEALAEATEQVTR